LTDGHLDSAATLRARRRAKPFKCCWCFC